MVQDCLNSTENYFDNESHIPTIPAIQVTKMENKNIEFVQALVRSL